MLTVWVVFCDEVHGDRGIDGIYTTKELAEQSVTAWKEEFDGDAWVEEWTVLDKHRERDDG